ncbi:hypothetical protein CBR_g50704 [Chara braunii]|uniref:Uncharacterized protein n=1 Tax=Chara braunii TaxID=69332 RepID=A0A388K5L6_CHABU|nr:hypothetical protein CBR_g50704 [Chara braunii]|eukprot:GBG65341.1 hypothetical protein CBR_g50704 [Chara braunii]
MAVRRSKAVAATTGGGVARSVVGGAPSIGVAGGGIVPAELVPGGGPGPRTPCVVGFVAGAVGSHAVMLAATSGRVCVDARDLIAIVVSAVVGIVPHAAAGFGVVPLGLAPVVAAPSSVVASAFAFAVGIAPRGPLGLGAAVLAAVVGIVPHAALLAVVECAAVPPGLAHVVAAAPTGVAAAAAIAFAAGIAPCGSLGPVVVVLAAVVGILPHAAQLL